MKLKRAITFIAVLALCLAAAAAQAGEAIEGQPLKDFTFEGIDGSTLNTSELRGKPVVLVIAATWCPPCKREAPNLERAYLEYKEKGVTFIGVFSASSHHSIEKFAKKYGLTFPLGKADSIREQFGWKSFPKTAFIAPDGTIERLHTGEIKYEELVEGITEIME